MASHLEACKVTCSIGSDLLTAPFPAAALSWGLALVASTVTPPHSDFSGLAIKIHSLMGHKIWFVISKHQEDERGETWDTFVWDFQADSKVNSDVYQCEVVLVKPGTLWYVPERHSSPQSLTDIVQLALQVPTSEHAARHGHGVQLLSLWTAFLFHFSDTFSGNGLGSYSLSVLGYYKCRAQGHESSFAPFDGLLEKSDYGRREP